MLAKRIIPCLDIKDGRVVKGVNFVNLRDAGDPVEQARLYDAQGADELVFLDISATHEGRKTTLELVSRVAETVFMPLAVGGGIREVDDMRNLLLAGADKVSVNSAAVKRPELLSEGAARFGAQCIVLAIDARDGVVRVRGWQSDGGVSAQDLALQMRMLGLRTIIFTDVSRDGMGHGLNISATRELADVSGMDVIASGGVHTLDDVMAARDANLSGAIIGRALYEGTIDLKSALNGLTQRIFSG